MADTAAPSQLPSPADGIRAVVFDAYGTLFDVYSVGELAEELFPGNGRALAELWRERQIDYTRIRTLSNRYRDFWGVTRDALAFAAERLGLPLAGSVADRLMDQYARLAPFPENLEVLQHLRAQGRPLGILSNGTPTMIASAVASAGMDGLFDHVLSVESVRRYKTADEAYELGPRAFGVPAPQILFVSSNGWDACGATWFGYTTFWVNRAGLPLERLGVRPTAEGRSLEDVLQFLKDRP
jgi:2-haloacid dehalogenase